MAKNTTIQQLRNALVASRDDNTTSIETVIGTINVVNGGITQEEYLQLQDRIKRHHRRATRRHVKLLQTLFDTIRIDEEPQV